MSPTSPSRSRVELLLLLLLALVPVFFERATQECFELPQSMLLTTGALALLGVALASGFRSWTLRDPLGIAILLFVLSAAISTARSPNPAQSLHGTPDSFGGLVVACATAVVYFTSRSVSRGDPGVLERYARAAGLAAVVASTYALLQLAGLDPLVWGRTASYGSEVRIFGTLGHPNLLGAYLGMAAPLTVWLAFRARSGAERILWALATAESLVTIVATLSRGAWIGLGAGALAAGLLVATGKPRTAPKNGFKPIVLTALLAALVAAVVVARTPLGAGVAERARQITSLSAPTTQSRLHIWRAAWRMFQDHPAWGAGLDMFGTLFPRYRTPEYWRIEWGGTPTKAHNEALQILATQGIAGGIAALLVVALAVVAMARAARRGSGGVAAGAALVAFAVQDLTSFTVSALGTLAAALAGWLASTPEAPGGKRGAPPVWARALSLAFVLVLFVPLVLQPVRAQLEERRALEEPLGSVGRADALERASKAAPWDGRYPNYLGVSLLTQASQTPDPARSRDLLTQAAAAQRKAIAIEPQNGYYYSNLGRVAAFEAALHPPEASVSDVRAAFTEALARDPVNAELMDHASNSYLQLGQNAEARAVSLRAAALYPEVAQPLGLLGFMALQEHRFADAADTLKLAMTRRWSDDTAPQEAAWSNLSAAYLSLNRFEDARRAAEEALALDPNDKDAAGNRDMAIQALGARR